MELAYIRTFNWVYSGNARADVSLMLTVVVEWFYHYYYSPCKIMFMLLAKPPARNAEPQELSPTIITCFTPITVAVECIIEGLRPRKNIGAN